MDPTKFELLAADLARQQAGVPGQLAAVNAAAEELRSQAESCVAAFRARAAELGAEQLTDIAVTPVGPDEKHVDCVQFSVERGRSALLCVAIASSEGGKVRLVGPFRRGKTEGPCGDYPLRGAEVEAGLEQRLLDLIRQACAT